MKASLPTGSTPFAYRKNTIELHNRNYIHPFDGYNLSIYKIIIIPYLT